MTLLLKEDLPVRAKLTLPQLSDEEFFEFSRENPDYRIERSSDGVVVMAGTGRMTGSRNAPVTAQLVAWASRDGRGVAFDPSTMFQLPNTAMRSPDASWVSRERLGSLSDIQKRAMAAPLPRFRHRADVSQRSA
jgi:Uma2 family endonuclease